MNRGEQILRVRGRAGALALRVQGDEDAPAVYMSHSILASSAMWERQATLLAERGWRVVCADTRGHGASATPAAPYAMADLVEDVIDALDALSIARAHFVGLSLGAMAGFGLGIEHADRLLSLCLCDARADAPPAYAAPWDERIAIAREHGCAALADATAERWFGKAFLDAHPDTARRMRALMGATPAEGFVGCARAIQSLDYLAMLGRIATPTTLLVGARDLPLPQAMSEIQARIPGAVLEQIPDAGHLPNIEQPDAFDAALLRHFERVTPR